MPLSGPAAADRVIATFLRRASVGARARAAAMAGVAHGAWLSLAAATVLALTPDPSATFTLGVVAGAAATWLIIVAAEWRLAALRAGELEALIDGGDGLRTYLHEQRRGTRSPLFGWLAADLAARVARIPATVRRSLGRGRRRWRRFAYLLPVLLVLLLLRFIVPFGLRRSGAGGEPQPDPSQPPATTALAPSAAAGGSAAAPPRSDPAPEPPNDPVADAADPGPDGPPAPPLPVLPIQEEFAAPAFIGEGPSRQAKARVAEQAITPAERGATAPTAAAGTEPPAGATPPDFARAAERALRSRHVPPAERPFVRRYFEALQEQRR